MLSRPTPESVSAQPTSPLMLSDHLITLAQEADRAGYPTTARRLVNLACRVLDEIPHPTH